MSIRLTPSARDRMQAFLAQTPAAAAVRFGVKRTGCSGFAYTVDLAGQLRDDDLQCSTRTRAGSDSADRTVQGIAGLPL